MPAYVTPTMQRAHLDRGQRLGASVTGSKHGVDLSQPTAHSATCNTKPRATC
jgi:hypothetical protein